jgi:hypothetical protein
MRARGAGPVGRYPATHRRISASVVEEDPFVEKDHFRFVMGTRYRCAYVQRARLGGEARVTTPTACLGLRESARDWVADAHTLQPGDRGVPGFDRWTWLDAPARTLLYGVGRRNDSLKQVVLLGAGRPRTLAITE